MDLQDDDFLEFIDYIFEEPYSTISTMFVRTNENHFNILTDGTFKTRYRFSKECVKNFIMPLVMKENAGLDNRGLPVPVPIKLLTALRFYATGNWQAVCANIGSVSQASVSRIITEISECLAKYLGSYVKFPSNQKAITNSKSAFYEIAGFPDVIGCIDCTHIRIRSPGGPTARAYITRTGSVSLNVQVVSGPRMEILNIIIRWPGSTQNNWIFEKSGLKTALEEKKINGILLGDSDYAQKPYLFTPVRHTQNEAEIKYNRAHIKTRNVVENLLSVWKNRFSCLSKPMALKLKTTTRVIAACAVLHNIGLTYDCDGYNNFDFPHRIVPTVALEDKPRWQEIRAAFIERHFN